MGKLLVPDELWALVEPILPKREPSPKGGKPRTPDRVCLTGILFVLKTGLPWEDLPAEMGCGCGMSCWRRLAAWQADGAWAKVHAVLLDRLDRAGKLDWSKCAIDGSNVRAVFGG
jgi:transposase